LKTDDRLLALDGLRAIAILLVVVAHTITPRVPGGLGVTLFFFISGFIITRMLLGEDFDTGRVKPFYLRRIFRLAPALLVYILIAALAMAAVGMPIPVGDVMASLFYYANYHSFWVSPDGVRSPLGITWSLAIEEHFYVLFPMLLLGLRTRTERLQLALLAVLVATLLWRLVLVGSVPDARIYEGTDTRLDSLAYGCLLSVLCHRARRGGSTKLLDALSKPSALAAGLTILLGTLVYRNPTFRESFRYSLQGIAFIPLFCALFWRHTAPLPLRKVLESRPMVFVGAISYSLYLYHFLGASIATALVNEQNAVIRASLALTIGFSGALLSYYVVETPARRFGYRLVKRLSHRTDVPAPLTSSSSLSQKE
jgi:peptidoglycan/LPS O-acetylase OafA/YrhL